MKVPRKVSVGLLVAIFLVSFGVRAYRPLSRTYHWFYRSSVFNAALDKGAWATTYQSPHPGLTTMAIGGTTLRLYRAVSDTPAEALFSWAIPPYATRRGRGVAAGVVGLSLVIAGLIVANALALRKLGGWSLALGGAGLLAFSPFYLSQSRVFHVDGLVGGLMLLSALLLLVSLESGRRRYFVLSGLVGGLAVLTKVPSLFLVPFTGLALLAYLVRRLRANWNTHAGGRARWLVREAWRGLAGPLLLWIVLMILPFALWPAMWVEPLGVLQKMFVRTSYHVEVGHDSRFFAGKVYGREHPPLTFYPVVMAFDASFVTLTLFASALGQFTLWPKRSKLPVQPISFWLLVAYVFFFVVQMTIGAHQQGRYVLPAQLMLEVIAAVGLVGLVELVRAVTAERGSRLAQALPAALLASAVGLQALVALPYAPDYGAHHNHLLGGNRVARNMVELMGQNEGITYVADYLSHQPDSKSLRVGVASQLERSMIQYFDGEIAEKLTAKDDYHLFSVGSLQRDYKTIGWRHAWEVYGGATPQLLVTFDGVPFMWLYATQPPTPYHPIVIERGGGTSFVVLAWAWALTLVAIPVWALRRGGQVVGESDGP